MIDAFVTDPAFVKDCRWIVMDRVPIGLLGMTGVVIGERAVYFFILALENVTDHIIGSTVRTGEIQNYTFYGPVLLSQVHAPGTFQHETGNII